VKPVELVFAVGWAAFWLYWLVAAFSMKRGRVPRVARDADQATVEERYLGEQFPNDYPRYKRSTKMLVPLVL
jgi:protein-S-isoprenylcysteine O-methyltransferase Ste14